MATAQRQLRTLRHFASLQEALIARELLASEGVDAFVPDEHTVGVNPGWVNAFGGVRLQVRSEDLPRATEILESESRS